MSPNYPMPYYRNSECYWLLKGSRGSPFEIQFEQFHLEYHRKCTFDYLAVGPRDTVLHRRQLSVLSTKARKNTGPWFSGIPK